MAVATSTAILVGSVLAAGATSYFGARQLSEGKAARRAQEGLENDRKQQLRNEAAARAAAAAKAAGRGATAGGGRSNFLTKLGFGSGNTEAGIGSGNLFGN